MKSSVTRLLSTTRHGCSVIGSCWFSMLMWHLSLWLCLGVAFFLFVNSLYLIYWTQLHLIMGCYAFAWLIGFLSFLTPGGLGGREGILGLLLSSYMPPAQATLCALLCRMWMITAEIVLAGTAFFLIRSKT